MNPSRRVWITQAGGAAWAWAAGGLLGACASTAGQGGDRILDTATGGELTPDAVLRRLRTADIVLLGELHDNPHHHARRAALLAGLGSPLAVVAEHLPRGAAPALPAGATGEPLRAALEAAGFDAKSWRWPLHEPLFAATAREGVTLHGGNLEREAARRVAREGAAALPAALTAWVDAAPLGEAALAALVQDLQHGHCGHLDAHRTPGMVAAQRGRDAAMAATLRAELARLRAAGAGGRVVLLAGNGHVRRDYGVPTLLARQPDGAHVLSIGFVEHALPAEPARAPYDLLWATPAAARDDPCGAFKVPRPGSGAAS